MKEDEETQVRIIKGSLCLAERLEKTLEGQKYDQQSVSQ